jgi:cell wall-associated NlpC family hydrolase
MTHSIPLKQSITKVAITEEKEKKTSDRKLKLEKLKKIQENKAIFSKKLSDEKTKKEALALEERKKKLLERKQKLEKLKKIQEEKALSEKGERKGKETLKEKLKKLKEKNQHSSSNKKLLPIAKTKLGKRYVWGAVGPKAFDCSGFTSYVYKKIGYNIPRTSRQQSKYGKSIKRSDLKPGDLIFFDTSKRRENIINHVGIYVGDNKFIHASSAKKRVIITSLNKNFYSQRYKWAKRIIH